MKKAQRTTTLGALVGATAIAVTLGVIFSPGYAEPSGGGHPAAKATLQCASFTMVEATPEMAWTTLLSNTMHTPNNKDVFLTASLESGLYTSTEVKSKGGTKDTSSSFAAVKVRALVDGQLCDPGEVIFASRSQELSAVFQGLIDGCL